MWDHTSVRAVDVLCRNRKVMSNTDGPQPQQRRRMQNITHRVTSCAMFRIDKFKQKSDLQGPGAEWGGGRILASDRLSGVVWSDEGIVRVDHGDFIAL